MLILGPTVFLLKAYVQNLGDYLSELVSMTFNLYTYQQQKIAKAKSKQAFSKKQLKTAAKQMCQGLKFMKNKGVIHCDMKLENILFTDSKCKAIKLIDSLPKETQKKTILLSFLNYFIDINGVPRREN